MDILRFNMAHYPLDASQSSTVDGKVSLVDKSTNLQGLGALAHVLLEEHVNNYRRISGTCSGNTPTTLFQP